MPKKLTAFAKYYLAVFAILCIAIFACILRIDSSSSRLAHADEGEQALTYLKLYQTGNYKYSPSGAHGSILYYWAYICKKTESIFCEPSQEISILRLCLLPIFILSILAFFALKTQLNFATICLGILAWSISTLSILYSLYFIQEIFFALFVFLAMCYSYLALTRQNILDFVLFGVFCGLALSSKETFVISLAALFLPALTLFYKERISFSASFCGAILLSFICAIFVSILFYTSFFTNIKGLSDFFSSYLHFFDKSQSAEHSKDFLYYARILFIQKSQGFYFGEILISIFALLGALIGLIKKERVINYISSFCLIYFLILSLIAYKTPWLLLSLIMPMCVLFSYAFAWGLCNKNTWIKILSATLLFSLIFFQTKSSIRDTQRLSMDSRNPFLYVHTSKDLANLLKRIRQIKTLDIDAHIEFATKNSPFPIPYYLLKYKNISYNSYLENKTAQVIATDDPKIAEQIDSNIYQEELYGLRENLIIYLYIKREIFEEIIK